MNETSITYRDLFALLVSLGFTHKQPGEGPRDPHIFFHEKTDTILAFRREGDEPVTPADAMSTEVHLHARSIAEEPLESLIAAMPAANR